MNRVTQIYDENEMFDYAVKETEKAAEKMQDQDEAIDLECGGESYRSRFQAIAIPKDEDEVSLLGLDEMISRFLGAIGEYTHDDIETIFHAKLT